MTPKVSVVIPTHNRPQMLKKAIGSVLAQEYKDWEVIVIDDCPERPAEYVIKEFADPRLIYVKHEKNKGGGAARNTGIAASSGEFIAFLDDDDEWLPEKLARQMDKFEKTSYETGFCFSAVKIIYDDRQEVSAAKEGIADFYQTALSRFKGFITSSLVVKKYVFKECGMFDESLPSHQEAELILRISRKFKGLGFSRPLVKMTQNSGHEHINKDLTKRIAGRELVLEKHMSEFLQNPDILARHYFWLALWCRDAGQKNKAGEYFKKSWQTAFSARSFIHYLIQICRR